MLNRKFLSGKHSDNFYWLADGVGLPPIFFVWERMANLPNVVANGACMVSDGTNFIYFHTGENNFFMRYNVLLNSWEILGSPPTPFDFGASMVFLNGFLYCDPGRNNFFQPNNFFYRYNITSGVWENLAHLTHSASSAGGELVLVGNHIYRSPGGWGSFFTRYSIAGNFWTDLAPNPVANSFFSSTICAAGNFIFCFPTVNVPSRIITRYDIANNVWSSMGSVFPINSISAGNTDSVRQLNSTFIHSFARMDGRADNHRMISYDSVNDLIGINNQLPSFADSQATMLFHAPNFIFYNPGNPVISGHEFWRTIIP